MEYKYMYIYIGVSPLFLHPNTVIMSMPLAIKPLGARGLHRDSAPWGPFMGSTGPMAPIGSHRTYGHH